MNRSTVVLCRYPPNLWGVYQIDGGEVRTIIENVVFASAYATAMSLVFPHQSIGQVPDYIQTNSKLDAVMADPVRPPREGVLYIPEGGHVEPGFWTLHTCWDNRTGERFHITNLRRMIEELQVPYLSNRSVVDELQIRRDWRAIDFSPGAIERQEKESQPDPALAVMLELKEEEKARSLRQFGLHSPYFKELAGHLNPREWDALWQGWQREDMARLQGGVCADR